MCLVPGIADGRYLIDETFVSPDHLTQATCLCHECAGDGMPRRSLLTGALKAAAGAALIGSVGSLGTAAHAATLDPAGGPSATGDGVVFLGVNGGPNITPVHKQPALALVINGT